MKRLILLVLVCTLVIPMFSVASASKQLYGETIQRGSVSNHTFNQTQAGADFSGIRACMEFCLYANSDAYKDNVYLRTDVYYSFTESSYATRIGRAEFSNTLSAGEGLFFPAAGQYIRIVGDDTFPIHNTWYYRTAFSTNMPYEITGSYRGWISNTSSGD